MKHWPSIETRMPHKWQMSLEDESASVQGDVVLPWPLTTAGSLIKKKLLGLSYWFVLNLEAGCQQHFKCECGGSAITACCCRDSWLLLTAILPVRGVCAEVTNMQPFNPNDCLSWNDPLGREVMICLYCAIEWNSLLSTGLNHRGQSHLGCILRSLIFWFIAVLCLSLPDSPSSRLSQTSLVFFGSQELSRDCSFLKPLASTPGNKTLPIGETIFFPLFFSLVALCHV